jgi:hypothetical protein
MNICGIGRFRGINNCKNTTVSRRRYQSESTGKVSLTTFETWEVSFVSVNCILLFQSFLIKVSLQMSMSALIHLIFCQGY